VPTDTVTAMSNVSPVGGTAWQQSSARSRDSLGNPRPLLAEGLTALTEAVTELGQNIEKIPQQVRSPN